MRSVDFSAWLPFAQNWDWGAMDRDAGRGLQPGPGEMAKSIGWTIIGLMREQIPKPGQDIHSVVPLVFHKGNSLNGHVHPEHTVIFYIDPGEPACALLLSNDRRYCPSPGEVVVLGPDEWHAVEASRSDRPRKSLAIRVVTQ